MRFLRRAGALILIAAARITGAQASSPASAAPELFGRGIFSTGAYELAPTFSKDGRTAYFTQSTPVYGRLHVIVETHLQGGRWTTPEVAPFSGRYGDADPMFSPDGTKLFFLSKRPVPGTSTPKRDFDIWVADRRADGTLAEPRHVPEASGPDAEHYVSVAADGTLYISAVRPDIRGPGADIYRVPFVNGHYETPENLGPAVNTPDGHETTPWIAPDQSYLIFASRRAGTGNLDLFISFREQGQWTPAKPLGGSINSAMVEYCPIVSADGQWLYFTSERGFADSTATSRMSTAQWRAALGGPGNGLGDTYRVRLSTVLRDARSAASTAPAGPGVTNVSSTDSAVIGRQLDSIYARMSDAYRHTDAASVTTLYHARAFYLAPEKPLLRGHDDIRSIFSGILGATRSDSATGPTIAFDILDRRISGDIAYDIGQYRFGSSPASGKFIVIWRRGADGRWLFWADGYSTLRPRS